MYKEYTEHLTFIRGLGLKDRWPHDKLIPDLGKLMEDFLGRQEFLNEGLKGSKRVYNLYMKRNNVSEQSLFSLAWDVDSYEKLLEINFNLRSVADLKRGVEGGEGVAKDLKKFRCDLGALHQSGFWQEERGSIPFVGFHDFRQVTKLQAICNTGADFDLLIHN